MEGNLARHGDSFQGVGWTKSQANTDLRYQVMLELIRERGAASLLDFGCGAAHLLDHMVASKMTEVVYSGLDLSGEYLRLCRAKHPGSTFYQDDILSPDAQVPVHDYVVMNGIFNYKGNHSFDEMWEYCQSLLLSVDKLARRGFAFNAMTKHVDWERDDLFHLPLGLVSDFVAEKISRNFVIRHDYGLYEYTVYVYRQS